MIEISTHVLDTTVGRPASGIGVTLHRRDPEGEWRTVGRSVTDVDGRARGLEGQPGAHRLHFDVVTPFLSEVTVSFVVADEDERLHVPLLLGPYGYTVYRGS